MSYKPFKMRGSPFKRNFGIGEKEAVSPTKMDTSNILGKILGEKKGDLAKQAMDTAKKAGETENKPKETTKQPLIKNEKVRKVVTGIADVIQAGLDAGGNTNYLGQRKGKEAADKAKKEKAEADELAHKRKLEELKAYGEAVEKAKGPNPLTDDHENPDDKNTPGGDHPIEIIDPNNAENKNKEKKESEESLTVTPTGNPTPESIQKIKEQRENWKNDKQ